MQATPLFLGACALASIAGAVGGANISTQPIQRASIGSELIQRPTIAFDRTDTGRTVALPDHYAMTTPEGRVEVAELSTRGLYAQRRYGWREATYEPAPEPAFEEGMVSDPVLEDAPAPLEAETALALAEPVELPVAVSAGTGPRVIDVGAVLASR